MWRSAWEHRDDKIGGEYPTPEQSLKFLNRLEKDWRKVEDKVFKAIASIGGKPWRVTVHDCYITGKTGAFSIPLTIPSGIYFREPQSYMVDVLTHELIHRYLCQDEILNIKNIAAKKRWDTFRKKFKDDNLNVTAHVVVHAIHELVFLKVFNQVRLEHDKKFASGYADYKRAWDIVDEHGAQNIVKMYFK